MSAEIIAFKDPRSLAGLAAKPPALFLPDEKARIVSMDSSPPKSGTGTRGAPTTKRPADFRTGARERDCMSSRG